MDIKSVACAAIISALSINANASTIVINEFLPNAVGADGGNEWIELFNNGANPIDISDWEIQKATSSYSLIYTLPPGTSLLSGDYFVIGGSNIMEADVNLDIGNQLGLGNAGSSGDALRLLDGLGNIIDTIIYGPNNNDGFLDDFGNIALSFAATPNAGQSLGRLFDGIDTNHSGNDFVTFSAPTIGSSNNVSTVPVPAALWLFGSGLIGLIGIARRQG